MKEKIGKCQKERKDERKTNKHVTVHESSIIEYLK